MRLIIVAIVVAASYFGYSHYLDSSAAKAEAKAAVSEQAKVAAQAQVVLAAQQTAQVTAQYQAMVQSLSAQNAALATALTQRQAALETQKKVDTTLPPTALAERLQTLGSAPTGSVAVTGDNITLTRPGAVAVVQALEIIPVLQQDLKDETALEVATAAAKAQADKVIDAQATQIVDLNTARAKDSKAASDELASVKAQAKKNSVKWFKRGFGLGFIAGIFAGHAAGI